MTARPGRKPAVIDGKVAIRTQFYESHYQYLLGLCSERGITWDQAVAACLDISELHMHEYDLEEAPYEDNETDHALN